MWLSLLIRFLPYILGAAALVGGWLYLDRACWSTACHRAEWRANIAEDHLEAARKRATELALAWAAAVEKTDELVRHERNARVEQGRNLSARAANLDRTPAIRIGGDAGRVLRDSTNLANSAPAPIRDKAPAVAVPDIAISEAQLTTFVVDAAMAYLDAKSLHLACVNFYEGLRANTLPASP